MNIKKVLCYILGHIWKGSIHDSEPWRKCESCGEEQVYSDHFGENKWGWLKSQKRIEKLKVINLPEQITKEGITYDLDEVDATTDPIKATYIAAGAIKSVKIKGEFK